MKKFLSTILVSSFTMSIVGCGVQPMMQGPNSRTFNPQTRQARTAGQFRSFNSNGKKETAQKPAVDKKGVAKNTPSTAFDRVGEQSKGKTQLPSDNAFTNAPKEAPASRARRGPFDDSPFGSLPFNSFSDFEDYVRYSWDTVSEDRQYWSRRNAQHHFVNNRSAFRHVQNLYKPSRSEWKRFIYIDTMANSLAVNGRSLPYQNLHNPPSQAHYKYLPTQAAKYMPTFGEIVDYNRTSWDVPRERWDMYRAARYYQANYPRLMQMIMEHGPSKKDAWKLVHREITDYSGR